MVMKHSGKSISIIIPVYNEERRIKACLDSIASQTDMPDEVIVVDNNSSDKSVKIARTYDFVRVIHEKRQGRGYAYAAGFNVARGDILARINGDSRLLPDWVARVRRTFTASPGIGGLTGPAYTDTLPGTHKFMTTLWSRMYFRWNEAVQRINTLWGANMAISREAWQAVRHDVCLDDAIVHDDQDLAYLLNGYGFRIIRDNRLLVHTYGQHYSIWPKLREYMHRRGTTRRLHEDKGTLRRPGATTLPYWVVVHVRFWGTPLLAAFMCVSFLRSLPAMLWNQRRRTYIED